MSCTIELKEISIEKKIIMPTDRPLIFPIHVTRTTGFFLCFVWPNIAYHFQNSTFGIYNVHYVVMIKE